MCPNATHPHTPAMNTADVWVIEDNESLRETLRDLLATVPEVSCTLAVASCEEALRALKAGRVPQVVLMDLGLPGMGGVEGTRRLIELSPTSRVVVLTIHQDDDHVFDAICAGASGYLLKPAGAGHVIDSIRVVLDGGAPMNAFIARRVMDAFTQLARRPRQESALTRRETEILELVARERTQKQIAEDLFLSPHTVDTHLRNIYAKLHVRSRSGAVAKAMQEGWL